MGFVTRQEVSDHISAMCVEFDRANVPDGAHRVAKHYLAKGSPRWRELLSAAAHRACVAHFPDVFAGLMGACVCILVFDSERR